MDHVAQVGNLPYRRLAVGKRSKLMGLRITNPRYGRLPVCATIFRSTVRVARIHWCHANGQNQIPLGRVIIKTQILPLSPKNPGANE